MVVSEKEILDSLQQIVGSENVIKISYPMGSLNQNRYKGSWNPIFCYTTMGNLSFFYKLITTATEKYKYASGDIGFLILSLNHGATFYFEPSFYRDPNDGEESQSVEKLFLEVSSRLIHEGAFFDRPYPLWAKNYHSKVKGIKKVVDPKNIMNPGKLAFE